MSIGQLQSVTQNYQFSLAYYVDGRSVAFVIGGVGAAYG